MFMYYGAGTGRWSAQKLQPHNFKKTPAWMRTKEDDITDAVYQAFCDGMKAEHIEQLYGEPLEVLSGVIRNFIHLPGVEMLDGDYSGVEARIIAWLAGQEDVIQEWKDYDAKLGPGPYVHMAAYIYGVPVSEVTGDQREVGKRVILGAGFQMGWRRFIKSCLDLYQLVIPKDIAKKGIKLFRKKCGKIRDYWWMLNNSAIAALETGVATGPFSVRKVSGIPYLLFRLRSGRSLAYPYPEVHLVKWVPEPDDDEDEFGEPIVPAKKKEPQWRKEITYWGQIPMSGQWGRIKLYGGKLAENETQATAADFMAHGSITAESRGMPPFMLVHDQGLALRTGNQTVKDYEAALGSLPDWAKGFPMKVEAKIAKYYKK
jgi:DNA polymerase